MEHTENYAIHIDGSWSLEDLYRFPRAYEQVYFALEALQTDQNEDAEERIARAFRAFPWRGGYSAVSFYNQLKWATPRERRPIVKSIQYASPGWIELLLDHNTALQIGAIVTSVAGSIGVCNKVYNQIHTDLQKRKLLKIEVERKRLELTREEIRLVKESLDDMAQIVGHEPVKSINDKTGNPLISLKIILSLYRRIRILAEYKNKEKADFQTIEKIMHKNDKYD